MTINDFGWFVQTLVDRQTQYNASFNFTEQLAKIDIDSIQVNSEDGATSCSKTASSIGATSTATFRCARLAMDQLG